MRPYQYFNIAFIALLILLDVAYLAGIAHWGWLLVAFVVYLTVLFMAVVSIRWNFFVPSINRSADTQYIALTFDDGPVNGTAAILDILKQQNVPSAFFNIGNRVVQHPETVKRCYDEGHIVGNHSYLHSFNFDWQSSKKMLAEIEQANEVIASAIGKTPKLFRPPYGITNPNLAKAFAKSSMVSVGWSLRTYDTRAKDPQKLLAYMLGKLKGGDIILLHDTMPITAQILTEFIIQARKKGFTFARVDKLLNIEAYA